MFAVYVFDEMVMDDVVVFEGSLEECRNYVAGDEDESLYIVAEDGFSVAE